jgi:type II secretory pathway component PulJ
MKSSSHIANRSRLGVAGMTLVELLCACAIGVMILAGAAVTFSAVQRSLLASLYQMNAQNDANRVLCYLRRDLRGATNVQIAAQGSEVTLSLPVESTPALNLNLGASLLSLLTPQNAPTSKTVRYYRQGTTVLREADGATTELSSSATNFRVELQGTVVRVDGGFQPRFSIRPLAGAQIETTAVVHLLNSVQP